MRAHRILLLFCVPNAPKVDSISSNPIAGGGKESGKMGRKAPGPEASSGSPVS